MGKANPDLPLLLLKLIGCDQPISPETAVILNENEWDKIDAMAARHRLQPLLHEGVAAKNVPVPTRLLEKWKQDYLDHSRRSLMLQFDLVHLHDIISGSGIPFIALKGAYLAPYAYPTSGLRPLRDLDLLVPRDRATEIFEHLLSKGYRRAQGSAGDVSAYLELSHQMPPLRTPSGNVIEIHTRIFHLRDGRLDIRDPSEDPAFWLRTIKKTLAEREIRFPAPEDTLVHLIEHAVYGHEFDNGPLLLSDIAFLVKQHVIDWPFFWQLADDAQCRRAAMLCFSLARAFWKDINISYPDNGEEMVPERLILAVARASLRNGRNDRLWLNARLSRGSGSRVAFFWGRLFPDRNRVALAYPVSKTSPLIGFYYFRRLWTLLIRRLPSLLRDRPSETIDELLLIRRWLQTD